MILAIIFTISFFTNVTVPKLYHSDFPQNFSFAQIEFS